MSLKLTDYKSELVRVMACYRQATSHYLSQCWHSSLSSHVVIRPHGIDCFPIFLHDDVVKWKHFPHHWLFVRGIHRSPVNSPHKGQWRGALMSSLINAWTNDWVSTRDAVDLGHHRAHYDVTVMVSTGKSIASRDPSHVQFITQNSILMDKQLSFYPPRHENLWQIPWQPRHGMSNFLRCYVPAWWRVTGLLSGEFTSHRWIPLTGTGETEFWYRRLNKRLGKQSRRRWFKAPSGSLWRHCNGYYDYTKYSTYLTVELNYKRAVKPGQVGKKQWWQPDYISVIRAEINVFLLSFLHVFEHYPSFANYFSSQITFLC